MSEFNPTKALAVLVAGFRQERLTEETIALYERKLADIHPHLLEQAIHRILERSKFFPSIAEIRHAAAELAGLLPPATEEAMAIVREADVQRPVFRRDGTYAYTEHEWRWPESLSWQALGVIRGALAKVGESVQPDGQPVFGWDNGFKAAYTREAEQVVATLDLTQARKALPVSPRRPHLAEAPAPTGVAKSALEIVQQVVDKAITEEEAHRQLDALLESERSEAP